MTCAALASIPDAEGKTRYTRAKEMLPVDNVGSHAFSAALLTAIDELVRGKPMEKVLR